MTSIKHITRKWSIKHQINRLVALSTAFSLGLIVLFFLVFMRIEAQRTSAVDMKVLATTLANDISELLAYRDLGGEDRIQSSLDSIINQPDFEAVSIYSPDGELEVQSVRQELEQDKLANKIGPQSGDVYFSLSHLEISWPLEVPDSMGEGTEKWWLHIRKNARLVRQDLLLINTGIGVIFVITLFASALVIDKLQSEITAPIHHLLEQMEYVGHKGDYSVRVGVDCQSEIGELSRGFNNMISRIEKQDGLLKNSREVLELTVAERTSELKLEIEKRKEYEQELIEARDKAQAANRAKSEFLAVMSHEIRTPMNGILGMAALARETPLNNEQVDYIDSIIVSGNSLITLINDILDFSKIESQKLVLEETQFTLTQVVSEVYQTFKASALQKGIEFMNTVDEHKYSRRVYLGDPARIRQVIMNLVGNALKFTQSGSVIISVSDVIHDQENERAGIRISVKDTGIGIPADKISQIFELFQQADFSTTREYGGSGLGLAICNRLTNIMGGGIEVESELGKGSNFIMCFDVKTMPEDTCAETQYLRPFYRHSPEDSEDVGPMMPMRILLAEDHPVNKKLAVRLLEKRGHSVTVASDGNEALGLLWEKQDFDVILMDLHMPKMGGLDAMKHIRDRELEMLAGNEKYKNGLTRVPIIVLSASVTQNDQQLCESSGADAFVGKPMNITELIAKIGYVTAHNTTSDEPGNSDEILTSPKEST